MKTQTKLLTVDEAMQYLGMTIKKKSFLMRYVWGKYPKIESYKVGKDRFFEVAFLDAFLKRNKSQSWDDYLARATSI